MTGKWLEYETKGDRGFIVLETPAMQGASNRSGDGWVGEEGRHLGMFRSMSSWAQFVQVVTTVSKTALCHQVRT